MSQRPSLHVVGESVSRPNPKGAPVAVGLGRFDDFSAAALAAIVDADDRLALAARDIALDDAQAISIPDVVVLDVAALGGAQELFAVVRRHGTTSFVVFGLGLDAHEEQQLLLVGACCCLTPPLSQLEVADALLGAARGDRVTWGMRRPARRALNTLSPREREVLVLLCRGANNPQIARELGVSVETVKTHVSRILAKLGVESRRDLLVLADAHRERPAETRSQRHDCSRSPSARRWARPAAARNWLIGAPAYGRRAAWRNA